MLGDVLGSSSNSASISSSSCKTCGDGGQCPIGPDNFVSGYNPSLFLCQSGGTTNSVGSSSESITFCKLGPSPGFIAMVVILPLFGLCLIIAASCFCCRCCPVYKRRNPQAMSGQQMAVMVPVPMAPVGYMPQQGDPQQQQFADVNKV